MNQSEYLEVSAISATAIKAGRTSMLHMQHEMTRTVDEPTDAMKLGTLIHTAVLQPARLTTDVSVWDGGRRHGKAWDAFCAEHDGQIIVRPDDCRKADAIAAAVRRNGQASALLAGCEYEHSLLWDDPECGDCKARLDAVKPNVIADLKTTARIGNVDRMAINAGWYIQLGWYNRALTARYGPANRELYVIVAESGEPFDVAICRLGNDLAELGEATAVDIATHYRECEQAGVFPGVDGGKLHVIECPAWLDSGDIEGFAENSEDQL